MFLIRSVRWYYRDKADGSTARDLASMAFRDTDEAELHFRTGKWLSDCFSNCMTKEEHIGSLLWLANQPIRIRRDAAQVLEIVGGAWGKNYLIMHRIDGREVPHISIERHVVVGTYDRNGFHRIVTEQTAEELLLCQE